uniref:Uncharacterized protein n=1 Tax=Glossina austeni TaxID=7395 RepID=A0A1A9V165_GLOAU
MPTRPYETYTFRMFCLTYHAENQKQMLLLLLLLLCVKLVAQTNKLSHDLYNLLESQAKVHVFNETWQVRVLNWKLPHPLPRAFVKYIDKSHSNSFYFYFITQC